MTTSSDNRYWNGRGQPPPGFEPYDTPAKAKQRSWDRYFMGMAAYVATRSKDPSVKVGAVVVGPDNRVRSTGYNGFPSGVDEKMERVESRELKLMFTEHAERNALYSAAKAGVSTDGCTMYIHGLCSCADCARAIIQSGVCRVVVLDKHDKPSRWRSSMIGAQEMFSEARITVDEVRPEDELDHPQGA